MIKVDLYKFQEVIQFSPECEFKVSPLRRPAIRQCFTQDMFCQTARKGTMYIKKIMRKTDKESTREQALVV